MMFHVVYLKQCLVQFKIHWSP